MLGLLMGIVEGHLWLAGGYCVSNGEVWCSALVSEVYKVEQQFLYARSQYHITFNYKKDTVNI